MRRMRNLADVQLRQQHKDKRLNERDEQTQRHQRDRKSRGPVEDFQQRPVAAGGHHAAPLRPLDAGPFADIAALGTVERALAGLAATEDVYVRGLQGNRALIDAVFASLD